VRFSEQNRKRNVRHLTLSKSDASFDSGRELRFGEHRQKSTISILRSFVLSRTQKCGRQVRGSHIGKSLCDRREPVLTQCRISETSDLTAPVRRNGWSSSQVPHLCPSRPTAPEIAERWLLLMRRRRSRQYGNSDLNCRGSETAHKNTLRMRGRKTTREVKPRIALDCCCGAKWRMVRNENMRADFGWPAKSCDKVSF
jgi:hypothetical protein